MDVSEEVCHIFTGSLFDDLNALDCINSFAFCIDNIDRTAFNNCFNTISLWNCTSNCVVVACQLCTIIKLGSRRRSYCDQLIVSLGIIQCGHVVPVPGFKHIGFDTPFIIVSLRVIQPTFILVVIEPGIISHSTVDKVPFHEFNISINCVVVVVHNRVLGAGAVGIIMPVNRQDSIREVVIASFDHISPLSKFCIFFWKLRSRWPCYGTNIQPIVIGF